MPEPQGASHSSTPMSMRSRPRTRQGSHRRRAECAADDAEPIAEPAGRIASRDGLDAADAPRRARAEPGRGRRPDGRAAATTPTASQPRALDRGLLGRDGGLARARPRARDGQRVLLRRLRPDQRVHGRVPDPEPRARARRRRRAVRRVRPGLQRAARDGARSSARGASPRRSSGSSLLVLGARHGRCSSCSRRSSCGPFGDPGGDFDLAVGLSRVLFPIVVLLGLSGIVVGILNTYDHFAMPALTPVAWNLVIILGLVLGVPRIDDESAAALRLRGRRRPRRRSSSSCCRSRGSAGSTAASRWCIDWRDPAVKRVLVLMLPVTLTLGLINVNFVIDTLFASRLLDPELAPAAIDKAFRLYMLPQGIFAVAVTTVLFPTLSRLAARGRHRAGSGVRSTTGLRQIGFLLVPAGAALDRRSPSRSSGSSTSAASSRPRTPTIVAQCLRRSRSASSSTAGC